MFSPQMTHKKISCRPLAKHSRPHLTDPRQLATANSKNQIDEEIRKDFRSLSFRTSSEVYQIHFFGKMRPVLKLWNLSRIVLVMPRPIRWSLSYFEKCPPKNQAVTMESWKIFKFSFVVFFWSSKIFPIRIQEATDGPNPLRAKYKNLEKAWVHL